MQTMSYTAYTRIGNILPKHKLILLTGLAGTGKSYSLLKFLNLHQVSPIVMNLDEDPTFKEFNTVGMTSDAKSLQKLVLSAHVKGYEKCADLMEKLMEAGATAFICHMAGVTLQPKVDPTLPQTRIEAVRAYLVTLEQLEVAEQLATQQAIVVSQQSGLLVQQKEVIDHKNIKTDCSDTHFTIKRVRALNQGMKISPKVLLKVAQQLEAEVESVYGHYEQDINQYSREVWEEAYPDAILPE